VASRLEETYRRLVLRDHLSFVERALADVRGKGPVLDVGCGGGLLLGMLRERGYRVAGLDSSPEAASIAWKRQNVAAVCGSLANSPLRAGSCAAVLMFHVLEHLSDPRAYLEAAHALLPAGGKLIVQVPNAASLQHRWLGPRWNGLDVPRHLYDFRAQDVVNLVENCGFRVVRRKHFSLRDNPAGLASSLAPELDPMARRVRAVPEGPAAKLVKELLYFALTALSVPFAAAEAACGAGSSIMLEAVVRSSMPVSLAPEGHNS
jgi:SAM-dependent methyltransferase